MSAVTGQTRIRKFTPAEIARLSSRIRDLSGQIEAFSDSLQRDQFEGELWIDGGKKMYEAVEWIADWLSKLEGDLRKLKLGIDGRASASTKAGKRRERERRDAKQKPG